MNSNHLIKLFLSCTLLAVSMNSVGCPCFHRYYLETIFLSEKSDTRCEVAGTGSNRTVFLISHYRAAGRPSKNFGEVASTAMGCSLLVDNQVITEPYLKLEEKIRCDKEIMMVCDRLKDQGKSLMYPAYE